MKTTRLILPVLILLGGCGSPPATQIEPGTVLRPMTSMWEKAINSNDAKALGALYTEDAIAMPPNAPPQVGRDAIIAANGSDGSTRIELDERESWISGDLGFKRGDYLVKSGNKTVDEGKYIEIWKKVDGQWLIHRDIYNSNLPAD